jgi:hypothetical protein
LRMSSFDGSNPIAVGLKMSDFVGCDFAFNLSHIKIL